MPRTARNIVEFVVDNTNFRAVFTHQHCSEVRGEFDALHTYEDVPVYEEREVGGSGVLGSKVRTALVLIGTERQIVKTEWDGRVAEPIIVPGEKGDIKLRHLTTCSIQTRAASTDWTEVGVGRSMCSVKDRYRWQKGIKESLKVAIGNAELSEGPVLKAFYDELQIRVL